MTDTYLVDHIQKVFNYLEGNRFPDKGNSNIGVKVIFAAHGVFTSTDINERSASNLANAFESNPKRLPRPDRFAI